MKVVSKVKVLKSSGWPLMKFEIFFANFKTHVYEWILTVFWGEGSGETLKGSRGAE